ncbi:NAD(P)/FAD-dependent oxidoreductase [Devosia sp.]|jgi:3-phenylpropionate/trans-cinnamate dioxygenase ferredoxin reductase subunit|uniref:NAD(P)/FAD-dependent oxidoreductase n=1 Tax=Devosia sp. TaxID=1871048 RepID=UPI0037C0C28A
MAGGVVIVGAGEAGVGAAFALRANGFAGAVTLIGEETEIPYERPPLSKQVLGGGALKPIRAEADYHTADIALISGRKVRRLHRDTHEVEFGGGDRLAYDRLLLATGAAPRRLAVPGAEQGPIHYLRDARDAFALRAALGPTRRLAIVGGGLIGLEVAAAARALGAAVTVLEAGPRLLGRGVPVEMAEVLTRTHRDNGVRLEVDRHLAEIVWRGGVAELVCTDGSGTLADLVVVAIGVVPRTELAAEAGLALDNGIAVDAELRSSDATIYAAGDCCSVPHPLFDGRRLRLESWQNAQELGQLAALNLMGGRQSVEHVPWMWSDQYELGLYIAGMPTAGTVTVARSDAHRRLLFHLDAAGRLVGASGIGPASAASRDIRIAQRLIARRAAPDPALLADPAASLKALLSPLLASAG